MSYINNVVLGIRDEKFCLRLVPPLGRTSLSESWYNTVIQINHSITSLLFYNALNEWTIRSVDQFVVGPIAFTSASSTSTSTSSTSGFYLNSNASTSISNAYTSTSLWQNLGGVEMGGLSFLFELLGYTISWLPFK